MCSVYYTIKICDLVLHDKDESDCKKEVFAVYIGMCSKDLVNMVVILYVCVKYDHTHHNHS